MGENGVFISTLIISIIIIVFGEILPKNIGKMFPERVACFVVNPIIFFIYLFKPVTIWFSKINDKMAEHSPEEDKVTATEDELLEIVETIEREGVLEQDESELIQSAINFDSLSVRAVMTPKDKVIYLYNDTSFNEVVNSFKKYKYSRFPVMDRETKKIVGVIYQQDVFEALANDVEIQITNLMRNTMYISHRRLLPYALEKVQRQKAHLAIVVDNVREKNFLGIITLEDMLEQLVGEIYDEYDDLPSEVVEIGHHIFDVSGTTRIENLFDNYLNETTYPKTKAITVGTWVKSLFKGKIKKDDEINYQNLYIKITDCDETTIKRLEIHQLTKPDEEI
jgi:CBS domain containing-hemolysin-like protein